MPTTKSAAKYLKTSERRRVANKSVKSRILTTRKQLHAAIASGDKDVSKESFRKYCSLLDKAAKKGIIKANNVNRRKSRAASRLAAMA